MHEKNENPKSRNYSFVVQIVACVVAMMRNINQFLCMLCIPFYQKDLYATLPLLQETFTCTVLPCKHTYAWADTPKKISTNPSSTFLPTNSPLSKKKSNKMEIKGPHKNITASFCECSPKSVLLLTAPQSASILSCVLTSVSIHYSNKIPYTKPTSKPYQVQNACILTY